MLSQALVLLELLWLQRLFHYTYYLRKVSMQTGSTQKGPGTHLSVYLNFFLDREFIKWWSVTTVPFEI